MQRENNKENINENNDNIIVGIDLGTKYSCISIFKDGRPELILDQFGENFIPSIIAFENNIDPPFIGQMAKFKAEDKKNSIIFDIKRLIGKSFDDPNIKKEKWPFELIKDKQSGRIKIKITLSKKISENNNNNNNISTEVKEFSIELITSLILKHLKNIAENELKTQIKRAVISVPLNFNDIERELTKKAGEMAGFKIERIINEPTAAALFYGFKEKNLSEKEKILVINLGSGSFDVSLILLDLIEDSKFFEVLVTNGNSNFGGRNFDLKLLEKCLEKINKKNINFKENSNVIYKLLNECEKAKIILSSKTFTTIKIKNLFLNEDFEITFSREEFENECENIFKIFFNTIEKLINDSIESKKINSKDEIKKIILNSKIPFIKNSLEKIFPKSKIIFNSKEAISFGACLQGEIIKNSKEMKNFYLFDVTSFSLGIELKNGIFSEIIKKNSSIKAKGKKNYQTTFDYQNKILFSVYEGENEFVKNNHFLGKFEYKNFPVLPKGKIKISVLFEIDLNNIIKISVVDENENIFVFNKKNFFDENHKNLIDLIKDENLICFEEFKNNLKNFRKKILENNEKYFYQKKIIECYENFINKNFFELTNENNYFLFEKFHVYFIILINEYLKIFYFNEIENEIIKNIKKNLFKFMKIIIKNEKISIFSILNYFNINNELHNFCSIFIILDLITKGEKLFNQKDYLNSKKYFNSIENINFNVNEQIDFKDEIIIMLNIKDFYLREIEKINKKNNEKFIHQFNENIDLKNNNNEINKKIDKNLNVKNEEINNNNNNYYKNNHNNNNNYYNNNHNNNNNYYYNNNNFKKNKNFFNYENENIKKNEFDIDNLSINSYNTFSSNNFNKKDEKNFYSDFSNEELNIKLQNEEFYKNKNEFEKFGLNFINLIIKKYNINNYNNINIEEEYKKNHNKLLNKIKIDFNFKNCPKINENEYSIIKTICDNLN